MSIFDSHIEDVPVNAQFLRDIILRRKVFPDTSDIERYNRILMKIAEKVTYSVDDPVWEYNISLAALGITGSPFTTEYTNKINDLINKQKSPSDIYEWVKAHPISPCDKLRKFVNFMKNRGFEIRFRTTEYLKSSDRLNARTVIISWDNN